MNIKWRSKGLKIADENFTVWVIVIWDPNTSTYKLDKSTIEIPGPITNSKVRFWVFSSRDSLIMALEDNQRNSINTSQYAIVECIIPKGSWYLPDSSGKYKPYSLRTSSAIATEVVCITLKR